MIARQCQELNATIVFGNVVLRLTEYYQIQVKADVETQGEFVQSLAAEVRAAAYNDIKDVVDFVGWLDDELSFLVCGFKLYVSF